MTTACSFPDADGIAIQKAVTHCHTKLFLELYEIQTGKEDAPVNIPSPVSVTRNLPSSTNNVEQQAPVNVQPAPAPAPAPAPQPQGTLVSITQANELRRIAGLLGVDEAVVARSAGANTVDTIQTSSFEGVRQRMETRARQTGVWLDSPTTV